MQRNRLLVGIDQRIKQQRRHRSIKTHRILHDSRQRIRQNIHAVFEQIARNRIGREEREQIEQILRHPRRPADFVERNLPRRRHRLRIIRPRLGDLHQLTAMRLESLQVLSHRDPRLLDARPRLLQRQRQIPQRLGQQPRRLHFLHSRPLAKKFDRLAPFPRPQMQRMRHAAPIGIARGDDHMPAPALRQHPSHRIRSGHVIENQ